MRVALVLVVTLTAGCPGGATPVGGDCPQQLAAGDLVITEVMANPGGTDEGKEWIEIHNATDGEINLGQLRLVAAKADGTAEKVHVISAAKAPGRGYVVLGGMLEAARPSYVNYTYGNDLGGLGNSGGSIVLRCGGTLIDKIVYAEARDGKAIALDGQGAPDGIANDDLSRWCDAKTEFVTANTGTPGAPNDSCGGVSMNGTCKGGDGAVRAIAGPAAGQLVITEIMADPSTADATSEWFEVAVLAEVDLNGLQASTDPAKLAPIGDLARLDCIRVAAGTRLLFARGKDPMTNGGIPGGETAYGFSFGLTNGGDTLAIGYGGALVDTVTFPAAAAGASRALDPARIDAALNDDAANWCKGTTDYGAGGKGTPGAENASCGVVGLGKCTEGGVSRDKVVPAAGDLLVTELMPNPFGTESSAEWFELRATRDIDLAGVQLGSALNKLSTIPEGECRRLVADTPIVFARDPSLMIGLPPLEAWQKFSFDLVNTNGSLFVAVGGVAIDQATWTGTTEGRSIARDPADAAKWCVTPADVSAAYYTDAVTTKVSYGTPGVSNPACP